MHALRVQQDLLLLGVLVDVLPLRVQLQAGASDARLVAPATPVTLEERDAENCEDTQKSVAQGTKPWMERYDRVGCISGRETVMMVTLPSP